MTSVESNRNVWSPSQAAAQRAAKRKSAFYLDLNLWPFVAVLIVVLITFMVNTQPFHGSRWGDLPISKYAGRSPRHCGMMQF